MKTDKKTTALLAKAMSLVLVLGLALTGCGGNDDPGGNGGTGGKAGISWTEADTNALDLSTIQDMVWADGKFVAVTGRNVVYSTDGITWAKVDPAPIPSAGVVTPTIYSVAWGNGKFVAGTSNRRILHSSDGINWTLEEPIASLPASGIFMTIAYGAGKFVVGTYSGDIGYSTDGIEWTKVENNPFDGSIIQVITWANGKFIAGGENGKMATSTDGITWTAVTNTTFGTSAINDIVWSGKKFVAVGGSGYMDRNIAWSTNGTKWTAVDIEDIPYCLYSIAYGDGKFVAGLSLEGKIIYSSDGGTEWTAAKNSTGDELTIGSQTTYINCLVYGNNKFVAGISGGRIAYSKK